MKFSYQQRNSEHLLRCRLNMTHHREQSQVKGHLVEHTDNCSIQWMLTPCDIHAGNNVIQRKRASLYLLCDAYINDKLYFDDIYYRSHVCLFNFTVGCRRSAELIFMSALEKHPVIPRGILTLKVEINTSSQSGGTLALCHRTDAGTFIVTRFTMRPLSAKILHIWRVVWISLLTVLMRRVDPSSHIHHTCCR